ncbi:hypothetical protein DPMN_135634 [Dreissena polymorpha]|uniref:Uncharacterized protein n=1 Tax=Dreissena polymorpha TaxID=45954 RepID=A0A9D4G1B8_DREPO|nr:hypothetical protein DPMN_135634 [Dreissena polymorpha]
MHGKRCLLHCPSRFSTDGLDGDYPLECIGEHFELFVPGDVSKPSQRSSVLSSSPTSTGSTSPP